MKNHQLGFLLFAFGTSISASIQMVLIFWYSMQGIPVIVLEPRRWLAIMEFLLAGAAILVWIPLIKWWWDE